jgi:hypothetical protein
MAKLYREHVLGEKPVDGLVAVRMRFGRHSNNA